MKRLITRQRTTLGGRRDLPPIDLYLGRPVDVADELLEQYLEHGNGHGQSLVAGGLLRVEDAPVAAAPVAAVPAQPGTVLVPREAVRAALTPDAGPAVETTKGAPDLKAVDAIDLIARTDSAEQLAAWRATEADGKARRTVLDALDARTAQLAEQAEATADDDEPKQPAAEGDALSASTDDADPTP